MDRNTLLAFALISIVLVLTPRYLELINPARETEKQTQDNLSPDSEVFYDIEPQPEKNISKEEKIFIPQKPNPEKTTKIETDLYIATISSVDGGSIKEFFIKGHRAVDSSLVNLINRGGAFGPVVEAEDLDGNPLNLTTPWLLDS